MSTNRFQLLVVDDDNLIIESIKLIAPQQWNVFGTTKFKQIPNETFHAAFVDMHLTGDLNKSEGLEVIKQLLNQNAHTEIIAISGDLNHPLMEQGLKAGASRFLSKPLSPEEVLLTLNRIEALFMLRAMPTSGQHYEQLWIGESQTSQSIKHLIAQLSVETGPILIEGETGTGKEVVAHLLHVKNNGPLICLNVAAIPENLFESELFGYVKGAFTGANHNKIGFAEAANMGDLFLDEIEALPIHLQVKLLRFLESNEIIPVGAKESKKLNLRVICATNQKLEDLVKIGKFREDLLWRVSGKKIQIPPLRERADDIKTLANYFLEKERPQRNKSFTPEALEILKQYSWPGNVRELKRVCEQLSLVSPLPFIRKQDVDLIFDPSKNNVFSFQPDSSKGLNELLSDFEKKVLTTYLNEEPDIEKTAILLKVSRSNLYKKIKDFGITINTKKD